MDEVISKLMTPEECMQIAEMYSELSRQARQRAIELRAYSHQKTNNVETELLKALYAYEEILSKKNGRRTHASRTWQMVNRYGIIGAAEKAVNRKVDAQGYKMLVDEGYPDLTFEKVISNYPESFSKEAVKQANKRLEELIKI